MHSDLNDIIPISSSAVPRQVPSSTLISSNPGLRSVWSAVQMVAGTTSSVLIQGETGTGKELVARAVHDESPRKRGPYVKLNCAALPAGLAESELFGHERGAFTGAVSRTDGRFQQAHGGTLFLDEIGELPLELQPKLLRILQEQEYERVGGGRTVRVDVRLIAATNEDLEQMVVQRRFRSDLFYRLNVFPISVPPLRQRREDIPLLVAYFLRALGPRVNKEVTEIAEEALEVLKRWEWPGNVRELQNVIERAVIRSSGSRLEISIEELMARTCFNTAMTQTLAETERGLILGVLQQTNGVISGPNGAASRLGLPRTTLVSRMQRLGIVQRRTVLSDRGADQPAVQGGERRNRAGVAIRASPS
jgi:transcriptional regulator with GAF, ATPase, and Fis domain